MKVRVSVPVRLSPVLPASQSTSSASPNTPSPRILILLDSPESPRRIRPLLSSSRLHLAGDCFPRTADCCRPSPLSACLLQSLPKIVSRKPFCLPLAISYPDLTCNCFPRSAALLLRALTSFYFLSRLRTLNDIRVRCGFPSSAKRPTWINY